jgi:hypothetical protein
MAGMLVEVTMEGKWSQSPAEHQTREGPVPIPKGDLAWYFLGPTNRWKRAENGLETWPVWLATQLLGDTCVCSRAQGEIQMKVLEKAKVEKQGLY